MLDFGKTNLFINHTGSSIISKIIDDYDLMGYNCLLLDRRDGTIFTKCKRIEYTGYDHITDILNDNLFKIDIIIVQIGSNYPYVLDILQKYTELPLILIEDYDQRQYLEKDFDYIYRFYKEERDVSFNFDTSYQNFLDYSFIEDIKNNWNMSLHNVRLQYVREQKINDLLK